MEVKDTIQEELVQLGSSLSAISRQVPFAVPEGYFDGLPRHMLTMIKAQSALSSHSNDMLAGLPKPLGGNALTVPDGYFDNLSDKILQKVRALDAQDEQVELSPLLASLRSANPYTVPTGYFKSLTDGLSSIYGPSTDTREELEAISPILNSLKEKTTYTVPAGYFEGLAVERRTNVAPAAKVVSITSRKWFRYAAAALVVGFVASIGLVMMNNRSETINPSDKSFAWVQKNMKKVATDDIEDFVELASVGTPEPVKTGTKEEINFLLKDISDKEIQDFLSDTQVVEPESTDDVILN